VVSVVSVTTARVRDGKLEEILTLYGRLKKTVERLGGKARVVQQVYGPLPLTLSFVVENESWAAYGTFVEKAEKDSEYQAILAEARANPRSDIIQRSIGNEVAV
jgi:hypothetical protein